MSSVSTYAAPNAEHGKYFLHPRYRNRPASIRATPIVGLAKTQVIKRHDERLQGEHKDYIPIWTISALAQVVPH